MFNKLETPSNKCRNEFLAAVERSRQLHGDWVTAPGTDDAFEAYLKRCKTETYVSHWVRTDAGDLAGVINISEIVRGAFQSGYLGYYALAPHNGLGYMTEGLRAVVTRAFRELDLHRLEANIQPDNASSLRLVQRLGFRREGFSPRYLKIAGQWCDHERWAITVEEWPVQRTSRGRTHA